MNRTESLFAGMSFEPGPKLIAAAVCVVMALAAGLAWLVAWGLGL